MTTGGGKGQLRILTDGKRGSFVQNGELYQIRLPEGKVDKVLVLKSAHQLQLINDGKPLKTYRISLGKNPKGHKLIEGDRRTPRGGERTVGPQPGRLQGFQQRRRLQRVLDRPGFELRQREGHVAHVVDRRAGERPGADEDRSHRPLKPAAP